ncbi:MAG: redoxin domain-containing protein [Calditrichaeota bacterium]|nr:redoxin domain-containing protein [Calditrichota bacterium]
MKFSRLLIVFLLFPLLLFSQVKINGKVIGADGKPPVLAHVHLKNIDLNVGDVLKTEKVNPDGSFEITADEVGAYYLLFTAANHDYAMVPLIVEGKMEPVRLTIKLATLPYKEKFDEVKITGDWNDFSFKNPETMTPQSDGTFIYERDVEADTLAYQLLGLTKSPRSVNGTQSDRYVYDGGGDYRSIVKINGGKARIKFDPEKIMQIPAEKNLVEVTFENNKDFQEMWAMQSLVSENGKKYLAGMGEYRKTHEDIKSYKYDWNPVIEILKQKLESDAPLLVRQFAGCELATLLMYRADVDTTTLAKVGKMLPYESPLWAMNSNLPMMIYRGGDYLPQVLEQLKERNPIRKVRATALSSLALMADYKGEKEKVKRYYAELKEKYGDIRDVEFTLRKLDPNKKIRVGAKVPDFEVQLLNSQEKISAKSLLGKYYLLDFWATWCGPCVGEMENLHKAYEQFKDKVQFISLSLDFQKEKIAEFRAKKWKMPWINAYLNEDPNKEVAKIFEVMAIPRPILVNPQGVIVALEGELRGQRLLDTLAKFTQVTKTK